MSEFDVEMIETGADEMKNDISDVQSKAAEVTGSSKSLESSSKAYELPWLALVGSVLAFGKVRGAGVPTGKMRGKSAGVTVRGLGKLRAAKMQACA